jgi:hypothetical protein
MNEQYKKKDEDLMTSKELLMDIISYFGRAKKSILNIREDVEMKKIKVDIRKFLVVDLREYRILGDLKYKSGGILGFFSSEKKYEQSKIISYDANKNVFTISYGTGEHKTSKLCVMD